MLTQAITIDEAAAKYAVSPGELTQAIWADQHEGPIGFQREAGLFVLDDDNLKAWIEASRTRRSSRLSTDANQER